MLACTISEVAELTGLTHRAIRHYEQEGLVRPARGPDNQRRFDECERDRLVLIARLRGADVPLKDIRVILEAHAGPELAAAAGALLREHRAKVDALRARIDAAIGHFESRTNRSRRAVA